MTREEHELSEAMHLESILCTDMDKMVCLAEEGQELPNAKPAPWIELEEDIERVNDQLANLSLAAASATRGER